MTRPKSPRNVTGTPRAGWFKPAGVPFSQLKEIRLTSDEFEAIRLADMEGLYQEIVADKMNVSRPTVGRILTTAHKKIAEALVTGKAIRVEGGEIQCLGTGACCDDCYKCIDLAE